MRVISRRNILQAAVVAAAMTSLHDSVTAARPQVASLRQGISLLMAEATPSLDPNASTPSQFRFNDHSGPQIMYVGMLATWFELHIVGLTNVSDSFDGTESHVIATARENLELLSAVPADAKKFVAPDPFAEAHGHFIAMASLMAESADDLVAGFVGGSQRIIDRATGKIQEAMEETRLFQNSLPYELPDRNIVEG